MIREYTTHQLKWGNDHHFGSHKTLKAAREEVREEIEFGPLVIWYEVRFSIFGWHVALSKAME